MKLLLSSELPYFDAAEVDFLLSALIDGYEPRPKVTSAPKRAERKRCEETNCNRFVQSRKRCKRHGGGALCRVVNCTKSGKRYGLCHAHGGGTMCQAIGCTKSAQKRGLCNAHGGVDICIVEGCHRGARVGHRCFRHIAGRSNTSSTWL